MKIWLFNYADITDKGSNPRLLGYYQYLQKHGHSPCFYFFKSGTDKQDSNLKIQHAPLPSVFGKILFGFFKILFFKPCEVAYFYSPNALFIPLYIACRMRGIKVVIEKTELDSIKPFENYKDLLNKLLYRIDELLAERLSNQIIVISDRLKSIYSDSKLVGAFVPYHSLHEYQEPKSNKFTIGYFGSFGGKDDVNTLLEAFQILKEKQLRVQLKLIGNLPNKYSYIRNNEDVLIRSEVESNQINEELVSCDVLIAIREKTDYADYGFPSKLAEYLATGRPVICTPSSDIPRLLKDEENALFTEFGNSRELAKNIEFVLNNPEIAHTIGLKGRTWALNNWHPDVVLKEWMDVVSG